MNMKRLFVAIFTVLVSVCTVGASSVEVRSAAALYAQKDYAGAMEMLKKALKKNPKDIDALHKIAVLCYDLNDIDNAFKYIDKAIKYTKKDDPSLPVCYGTKASFYLDIKDTASALKTYDIAISIDPSQKEVLLDRAILFRKMGQYDKSTAELKKVIAMEPNQQAYRGVALNEYYKGNYKGAVDWYSTSLVNFPDGHYTYILRGNSYLKMKEYDKAVEDAMSAIPTKYFDGASRLLDQVIDSTSFDYVMPKLKAKSEKEPSELIWKNLMANLYFNNGRPYEAIDLYSAALHKGVNDYLDYLYIADCYSMTGEFELALAYCDSAYAVDPKKMRCWYQKMKIHTAMEQYDKALECADILIKENPSSQRNILEKRSDIKHLKGDLDGALADLEMMHKSSNVTDFDRLKKASLLYRMGRQKDAETIVNALLEKKSFASGSFSKFAYAILGQKDKMKSSCEEEVKNGFDKGLFNIACAYGLMGEYKEGLVYLRMAFEKETKDIFSALIDVDMIEYRKLPEFWELVNEFRPKKK